MNIVCWRKKDPITYSVFIYNKSLNRKIRKKQLFKSRIVLGDITKNIKDRKTVVVCKAFLLHYLIERKFLMCMNMFRIKPRYDCKFLARCTHRYDYGVKRRCLFPNFKCEYK